MRPASAILAFYAAEGTDDRGRSLNDIWAWNDDGLESVHDYIQWLFPLNEGSMFNPAAPLLTGEDIKAFRDNPALRQNLRRSFERILAFYGFVLDEARHSSQMWIVDEAMAKMNAALSIDLPKRRASGKAA